MQKSNQAKSLKVKVNRVDLERVQGGVYGGAPIFEWEGNGDTCNHWMDPCHLPDSCCACSFAS